MAHFQLLLTNLNDGVLGMELPVGTFKRLRNMLYPLYNVQSGDQVVIQLADVADDADDGGVVSLGDMGAQILRLDPLDEIPLPALPWRPVLQ